MQFPDNDMDELFREAAENYPLKVTGADWSKVQSALPVDTAAAGRELSKKWWSLLLLILVPFVCTVINNRDNNVSQKTAATAAQNKVPPAEKTIQQTGPVSPRITNHIFTLPQPQNNLPAGGESQQDHNSFARFTKTKPVTHVVFGGSSVTMNTPVETNTKSTNDRAFGSAKQLTISNTTSTAATPNPEAQTIPSVIDKKTGTPVIKEQPAAVIPTETKTVATAAKQQKNKKSQQAKFYLSLLGGPDASRVKSENVKHIGFSAGAGLGYNMNKHFAVEAAALYSEKHYKSAYKDFNNSKTNLSSYDIIQELDGECKMIEIPLTLRYNFDLLHNNRFFAAAGLSSYIMKKESYSYDYTYSTYPGSRVYHDSKSYSNSSKNRLSVLQLSAGWQRNIGRHVAVRVQPYYNVPLSGVGIGSLPISGAGILAGLSIPIK